MTDPMPKTTKPHPHVASFSARFHAVQALYQANFDTISAPQLVEDAFERIRLDEENQVDRDEEDFDLVKPDGILLKKIILGVIERLDDLKEIIEKHYDKRSSNDKAQIEPLLMAIFLASAFELLAHEEIDAPIIINDYVDVTYSFYNKGEMSLVNGILDKMAKTLRGDA